MQKILFVTGSMVRGGAERVISLLSARYAQLGWEVSIAMLLHDRVEYALDSRVQVINLSDETVSAVRNIPRLMGSLRKLVKSQKPDAVVAFMAPICLIAGLACKGLKTRLILSERNDPSVGRSAPMKMLLNHLYGSCDLTVLQTKRVQAFFPEKVRRNSVIIGNPIAVKCAAADTRKKRIVTAGRLENQKNQAMLIDAFAAVAGQHPEYTLDIYGEGRLAEQLQRQIDGLGLADRVKLRGNVPDIHEQMADAEIFALPSDYEGLSNALLEAMMMGLSCVATDCAGCDEVIEPGVNGLLIPVGDTQAMAQALLEMIRQPDKTRAMGEAAQKTAEGFAVEAVIGQWRKAIEG